MMEVIIKVGVQSKTMLRNVKMLRAVTAEHLKAILEHSNAEVVVIEGILEKEYDEIKSIIESIQNTQDVYFYIPDTSDEVTSGLADELEYDIYLDLHEIQGKIAEQLNINVGTEVGSGVSLLEFESDVVTLEEIITGAPELENTGAEESKHRLKPVKLEPVETEPIELETVETETVEPEPVELETVEPELVESEPVEPELVEPETMEPETEINIIDTNIGSEVGIKSSHEVDDELKSEVYTLNNKLSDCESRLGLAELERETLNKELGILRNEVDRYRLDIDDNKKKYEDTKISRDILEIENAALESNNRKLSEEADRLRAATAELEDNITELESQRSVLLNKIDAATIQRIGLNEKIKGILDEYRELVNNGQRYVQQIEELKENVSQLNVEAEAKSRFIGDNIKELNDLRRELLDKDKEVAEKSRAVNVSLENAQAELATLNLRNNALEIKAETYAEKYKELLSKFGVTEEGAVSIIESKKTLEVTNAALKNRLAQALESADELKTAKHEAENRITALEITLKSLKENLKTVSVSSSGLAVGMAPLHYSGSGRVIPVFGCGSYGVTTIAMSMAYKLCEEYKVCFVDFDLLYPKAEQWFAGEEFNGSPVLGDLRGVVGKTRGLTSASAFFTEGVEFVINNYSRVFRRVVNGRKKKSGYIDYFSGLYEAPDWTKIMAAGYGRLFNYMCNAYDYVVVDMGKFGYSSQMDSIIKEIAKTSYAPILVSPNRENEMKLFRGKLDRYGIELNEAFWVSNISPNSARNSKAKAYVTPAHWHVMEYDDTIMGEHVDFTKSRATRVKWDKICEDVIK